MALSCGAALVIWSLVGGHPEMWKIGLPGAVAGLGGLLLGLVSGGPGNQSPSDAAAARSREVNRSNSGSTTRLPASPPNMARHISAPK
jgi:hypothetical protein